MLPTRETFIDYFPLTGAGYPGFIRVYRFELRMKEVIRQAVASVGDLNARFAESPQQSNRVQVFSDRVAKSESSIDQTGLDKMTKERAIKDYYQDIKNSILSSVNGTEWRMPNEMRMSEEMYAQSSAYFKTAVKDITVAAASAGMGKAVGKTLTKYSGQTVNKFIQPGTKLNSVVGKGLGKEFKIGKGIFAAEFQGVDYLMGKSVEGYAELGDQLLTSDKVKQYEGFDPDYFGDNWLGNSIDFLASAHPATAIQKKLFGDDAVKKQVDLATDLIPVVSWCKTGVTSLVNIALGVQTQNTANSMKTIEDKSNQAEWDFNRKLKQTIYNDVSALHLEEIKKLIDMSE